MNKISNAIFLFLIIIGCYLFFVYEVLIVFVTMFFYSITDIDTNKTIDKFVAFLDNIRVNEILGISGTAYFDNVYPYLYMIFQVILLACFFYFKKYKFLILFILFLIIGFLGFSLGHVFDGNFFG